LITMQNLVVVSHTVCAHVGLKNLGDAGAPRPWDGGVADLRNTLLPTCYHNKFGSSSHTVWA